MDVYVIVLCIWLTLMMAAGISGAVLLYRDGQEMRHATADILVTVVSGALLAWTIIRSTGV